MHYGTYHRSLSAALDNYTKGDVIAARDVSTDGAKHFVLFRNHDELLTHVNSLEMSSRCMYEYLCSRKGVQQPVKLCLDIDIVPVTEETVLRNLRAYIETIVTDALKIHYDIVIDSTTMVVLSASSESKTSEHYVFNGFHFASWDRCCTFVRLYLGELISDEAKTFLGIDPQIYTQGGRAFRMSGCNKLGSMNHFKVTTAHDDKESLVTYVSDRSRLVPIEEGLSRKGASAAIDTKLGYGKSLTDSHLNTLETLFIQNILKFSDRSICYDQWIRVGIRLRTASCSFQTFERFSTLCPEKHDTDVCLRKWESFARYPKSAKGLMHLLHSEGVEVMLSPNRIELAVPEPDDRVNVVAEIFARLYGDVVKFDAGKLYVFDEKWVLDEHDIYLTTLVRTHFIPLLETDARKIETYLNDSASPFDDYYTKLQRVHETMTNVRKPGMISLLEKGIDYRMRKMFMSACHAPGFGQTLDQNTDYIGFTDGVFDLGRRHFRPHAPDIPVTMTTGYPFSETYGCPFREDIDRFMTQLFPDAEVLHFMKRFLASCVGGRNEFEILCFWTGSSSSQTGSNGKSTLCSLLQHTLGEYYLSGDPALLTTERGSARCANSALAQFKNKRFVTMQEIEGTVNMSKVKELTGNDDITCRDLYAKNSTFKPTWNIVPCCNQVPELSSVDGGTKRRVRKIPFESKFVDDTNDPKWAGMKHTFPIDTSLKRNLRFWGPSFVAMLLEWYYDLYLPEGLGERATPQSILTATDKLFEAQDEELNDFLDNCIERVDDPTDVEEPRSFIRAMDIKARVSSFLEPLYKTSELYDFLEKKYGQDFRKHYDHRKGGKRSQCTNVILDHRFKNNY